MSFQEDVVTVVSGLPRSGTSMMMRMLEAGGMELLADHRRGADDDNPAGYFELERVKQIEHDQLWLEDARGKAVKMVSVLLKHLPADYSYTIIFMRRNLEEVLASQRQMLLRRGEPADRAGDAQMMELFGKHLRNIEHWLGQQPNMHTLHVNYNELVWNPAPFSQKLRDFLGGWLDARRMAAVVDTALYRQRR
jgi:hypothetical protein